MTGTVDHDNAHDNPHEVQELILHGDNTSHLYHRSKVPVMQNLEKKFKKGVYDHEKAKKLWRHHADRVAQDYTREHGHAGGPKWHEMFSTAHRNRAAAHWADEHHEEMRLGNFHLKESINFAEEIVFAAMGQKPVDAQKAFSEGVLERSKYTIDDKKVDMVGHFFEKWDSDYETPKSKRGMWKGWSKDELEKADKTASGKRKKEIDFALRAKSGWGKVPEEVEVDEADYHLNPEKKGMWKGKSKEDIEKAKTAAKKDGNVTREREANFALLAKNGWKHA